MVDCGIERKVMDIEKKSKALMISFFFLLIVLALIVPVVAACLVYSFFGWEFRSFLVWIFSFLVIVAIGTLAFALEEDMDLISDFIRERLAPKETPKAGAWKDQ